MAQPKDPRLVQDVLPLMTPEHDLYTLTSHVLVPKGANIEEFLLGQNPADWSSGKFLVAIKDITKVQ